MDAAPSSVHVHSVEMFQAAEELQPTCRCRDIYAEVREDEQCVLVPDMFPKSQFHALIIARDTHLMGPDDLRPEHLPLLQHMQVRPDAQQFGSFLCFRSSLIFCLYTTPSSLCQSILLAWSHCDIKSVCWLSSVSSCCMAQAGGEQHMKPLLHAFALLWHGHLVCQMTEQPHTLTTGIDAIAASKFHHMMSVCGMQKSWLAAA